jgi:hypothetical protein
MPHTARQRVLAVEVPLHGIGDDVLLYEVQFAFVSYDVFEIIALPTKIGHACATTCSRYEGLVGADDNGKRFSMGRHNRKCIAGVTRGGVQLNAPTGHYDDSVEMVWHDNPFIQFDFGEMAGYGRPALFRYSADCHVCEMQRAPVRANGYEVRSGLRAIVSRQTDGTAMVSQRVEFHAANILALLRGAFS